MPQLIKVGDTLYRINPVRNIMEISRNNGIHWVGWGLGGPKFGRLKDLLWYKDRLMALTETGLWYSRNGGADWGCCGGGKIVENLVVIYEDGRYLYGMSQDGVIWYSTTSGATWGSKGK